MKRLAFVVPGPPVPCGRARVDTRRRGRPFTPPKTEAYERLVGIHALAAMGGTRWHRSGLGPFRVRLDVWRVARRGDADNYAKAVLDGMTRAGVWQDDHHVCDLHVVLWVDKEKPRLEVAVEVVSHA